MGCHLWGRTESDMTEVTEQRQQQCLEKSSSGTMQADGDYGGDVALVYLLHPSH